MAIILHSSGPLYPGLAVFALRSFPPSPQGQCAPVTRPPILERGILYLKRACFHICYSSFITLRLIEYINYIHTHINVCQIGQEMTLQW